MIEVLRDFLKEFWDFVSTNFDPARDMVDIALVGLGIYSLLLLIRGTRAFQILGGLIVLLGLFLASEMFQLATLGLILDLFLDSAVLIIIVLFQHDIRRALARVGRGFFPSVSAKQESQIVEEVVRAAQGLAQKRVGALIVLQRETALGDHRRFQQTVDRLGDCRADLGGWGRVRFFVHARQGGRSAAEESGAAQETDRRACGCQVPASDGRD